MRMISNRYTLNGHLLSELLIIFVNFFSNLKRIYLKWNKRKKLKNQDIHVNKTVVNEELQMTRDYALHIDQM